MPLTTRYFRRRPSRVRVLATLTATAICAAAGLAGATPASAVNTSYYLDCSALTNGSGTQASPWNALTSVNAMTFGAGDRINVRAGTTCTGQLIANGSGASGNPIILGSYGTGAKPILDAAGATGAVILLQNVQQWEISGLELRNQASTPDYRSGILAINSSGTTLNHLKISGMTIRNISGWSGGWYSTNAGVGIQTNHTSTISTWNDIQVSDNTFENVDRIAVAVTPDHDGQGTGLSTGVKIQRNTIRFSGGDDILVVKGQGALIEGNDTAFGGAKSINGCPPSGQYCNGASAGIWMAGSSDTLVQGNSVVCNVNEADGQAFDVDWGNHNTTVQYNYGRNNRGGFILMMPPISVSNEPTSRVPSDGTVVRYNVSEDDANTTGCPLQPAWNGPRDVIHFAGSIANKSGSSTAQPDIYNNTIFIPSNRGTYVVGSRSGVNASGSFLFRNNLVQNFGTGGYVQTTGSTYANNIMYGNRHSTEPANSGTITLDPQLSGPLPTPAQASAGSASFKIRPSSPAINAGVTIANNGGRDFSGTPLPSRPTIGAFESTGTLVSNPGFETGTLSSWTLSGNGTASQATGASPAAGTTAVQTGPTNSGIQQTINGLSPNTTYMLNASLKVATAGEQIALGVKDFGGAETYVRTTSTGWAQQTAYFTTGASNTSATIYCYKNTGSGAGYCDNFAVQAISSPANLANNPGFESGSLAPWTLSGGGAAVAITAANSGTYGLLTGAANSGANQSITGLLPGASYVLSGFLRAAPGEEISLGVKGMGSAETFQRVSGSSFAPASVRFTTGTNVTSASLYCYKNDGSSAGACDDLRLTRIG